MLDNSIQLRLSELVLSNYLDNSTIYDTLAKYGRCDISILTLVEVIRTEVIEL
jgi:hypothetical protein